MVLPPLAPWLLPSAAARLARAGREMTSPAAAFPLATAVLPFATFFGLVGGGIGSALSAATALAFVVLPALGLVAGATAGRRREELAWLSAAVAGIGALGTVLAFTLAEGADPGAILATRFDAARPELLGFYRNAGWSEETLAATGAAFDRLRDLVVWQLPGLLLSACVLHGALLVYAFGRRAGLDEAPLAAGSFATFRTPLAAAAAFVPAGALADTARFDLIVANPPYIAAGDPHLMQGDLRFEPVGALTDHADGLSALGIIAAGAGTSRGHCPERFPP